MKKNIISISDIQIFRTDFVPNALSFGAVIYKHATKEAKATEQMDFYSVSPFKKISFWFRMPEGQTIPQKIALEKFQEIRKRFLSAKDGWDFGCCDTEARSIIKDANDPDNPISMIAVKVGKSSHENYWHNEEIPWILETIWKIVPEIYTKQQIKERFGEIVVYGIEEGNFSGVELSSLVNLNLSSMNFFRQNIGELAKKFIDAYMPETSKEKRAAFANSVSHLATGVSGGYGGPSVREHLAITKYSQKERIPAYKAGSLLSEPSGAIFGEITSHHQSIWCLEKSFNNDRNDLEFFER